ncbi:MAG: hypothetical protein JO013_05300 [Alphaproteobacteria bacterium]|nr:hypothetical protein [Alphaproteobacteria bacterium]
MKHALALSCMAAIAAPAAAQAVDPKARDLAEPVLRQLLLEAERSYYRDEPDGGGALSLWTRPRATDHAGLCTSNLVDIEVATSRGAAAPRVGEPARIRSVAATSLYHVVLGLDRKPRWDLSGAALDRACADPAQTGAGFEAGSIDEADRAVRSLGVAVQALSKPASPIVHIVCGRIAYCPTAKEAASLIEATSTGSLHPRGMHCPARLECIGTTVFTGPGRCSAWAVMVASEPADPMRVRRIEIRYSGPMFECDPFPPETPP